MGPLVGDEVGFPAESFPTLRAFVRLLTQVGALKAYELANFPSSGRYSPVVLTGGISLDAPRTIVPLKVALPIGLLTTFPSGYFQEHPL